MYDNIDEQAIRRRVEKRLDARREFIIHAMVFVVVNVAIWLLWAALPGIVASLPGTDAGIAEFAQVNSAIPWPIFVTVGWGIGLVAHYLTYYYKHGEGARRREEIVSREVQQELERRGLAKRKHGDAMMLTDDGELSDADYADDVYADDFYEADYDAQSR